MNQKRYTLVDGIAMNAEFPDTFEIPSAAEIAQLKQGDIVKVGARILNGGSERFWVLVNSNTNGKFTGFVANDLLFPDKHGLNDRSPIEFESKNVLAIWSEN